MLSRLCVTRTHFSSTTSGEAHSMLFAPIECTDCLRNQHPTPPRLLQTAMQAFRDAVAWPPRVAQHGL
jgi:hypothetical protein